MIWTVKAYHIQRKVRKYNNERISYYYINHNNYILEYCGQEIEVTITPSVCHYIVVMG